MVGEGGWGKEGVARVGDVGTRIQVAVDGSLVVVVPSCPIIITVSPEKQRVGIGARGIGS
jgi:hypothetical protein